VTKRVGLLSFGHWMPFPHSQARSGLEVLLQLIDLEVAAEELVSPVLTVRVHHPPLGPAARLDVPVWL
jgi:hypothetical protein